MILPIDTGEVLRNEFNLPVVYIAGKVTGLPYKEVSNKFKIKQLELEAQDYFVLNPCDIIPADCNWPDAMRVSVVLLANADFIYLLPDWYLSDGATLEMNLAKRLGIETLEC